MEYFQIPKAADYTFDQGCFHVTYPGIESLIN